MISKLKEACGFEYTNKLQRMFTGKQGYLMTAVPVLSWGGRYEFE